MKIKKGLDAAIRLPDEDRYGYTVISKNLANSILLLDKEEPAVIGIEGAWGTGKTSLLNLLLVALKDAAQENTFILNISPWLDGDNSSPVESLLLPVAAIIAEEEEKRLSPDDLERLKKKKQITSVASTVLKYIRSTNKTLAPFAEFSGNFIPGIGLIGKGMKLASELELSTHKETATELRKKIDNKIEELNINFIVILDDLDRLEPVQAVEVIRLIKSVADFSRFKYVICYDRQVLSQAIENGLNVADGELYLQKIVQISFHLPRHESFDLRREFFTEAQRLYKEVNDEPLGQEAVSNLFQIVDTYGTSFSTPREVRLTINTLRFVYHGMRDYIYFPDLCLLHLIKTLNTGLYNWIEYYLTERSIVESGDGSVSEDEQTVLSEQLNMLLQKYRSSDARNPEHLSRYIPGITKTYEDEIRLFKPCSDESRTKWAERKRLSSDAFYRYYFSFSAPQNILPPEFFEKLKKLAATDHHALQLLLIEKINGNGISSRTWFEHIFSRFTRYFISQMSYAECEGIVWFLLNYGDDVSEKYRQRNEFISLSYLGFDRIMIRLFERMKKEKKDNFMSFFHTQILECKAIFWMTSCMQMLLKENQKSDSDVDKTFEKLELENLMKLVSSRLNQDDFKSSLQFRDSLLGYLNAWQEIDSTEAVCEWVSSISSEDDKFLDLLLKMRSVIYSNEMHRVLYLEKVKLFFPSIDINQRINIIESEGVFKDKVSLIRSAIELSDFF